MLGLEEKIKHLEEQSSLHDAVMSVYSPKLNALKRELSTLDKKKSKLRYLITGRYFTLEVNAKRATLVQEISAVERIIPENVRYLLSSCRYRLDECKRSLSAHENALAPKKERLERQAKEKAKKEEAQRKKMEELRAAAASVVEETRRLGTKIRGRLETQDSCPYCGDFLGEIYHADHIYPVSKGGRSVESNMVLVCVPCNAKKSDLTLTAFIREFGLDREKIEARLAAMVKEF